MKKYNDFGILIFEKNIFTGEEYRYSVGSDVPGYDRIEYLVDGVLLWTKTVSKVGESFLIRQEWTQSSIEGQAVLTTVEPDPLVCFFRPPLEIAFPILP